MPGVPVWALTASDTTRPAQAQDPLPDMGIAPRGLMTTPGTFCRSGEEVWRGQHERQWSDGG
ncbi:hypothetical protein MJ390_18310 [Klebsiella pneumoniae]|nr:hypothetical protein MJ390_18310 [Klebsiella pneumoniae]